MPTFDKKLKLTSDKDNKFVFENGWILNTEVTLIVSNPDKPATVILNGEFFDIRYSKFRVVTADGSPCNTPICVERFIGLIGSEFDGTLSISNRIFIGEESRVRRLDAHENCSLTIEPGTVESFRDYRCLDSHMNFSSYAEFVDYVNKLDSMGFKEVPVLYHNEQPFSEYDRMLNRFMRLLEQKQKVRLRFGTKIDNTIPNQKPYKRYTLESDEYGQVFVEAKFLENRDDQKERSLFIQNTTEEYPTTIIVKNCESERIRIENVRISSESAPFGTATITFENPPHLIMIIDSPLPDILVGNAEINIVDSKVGVLKLRKLAHLDRLYNSEVAGIKNTI